LIIFFRLIALADIFAFLFIVFSPLILSISSLPTLNISSLHICSLILSFDFFVYHCFQPLVISFHIFSRIYCSRRRSFSFLRDDVAFISSRHFHCFSHYYLTSDTFSSRRRQPLIFSIIRHIFFAFARQPQLTRSDTFSPPLASPFFAAAEKPPFYSITIWWYQRITPEIAYRPFASRHYSHYAIVFAAI